MKYTVSILCHNNVNLTKTCLESIYTAGHVEETELIVTDNGSSDETAAYLARQAQHRRNLTVLTNEKNEGFITPNMRALFRAQGEFFVMLNNDCVVSPGWLGRMADTLADPRVQLVGNEGGCNSLNSEFRGYHGVELEYLEGSCLMGRTRFLREIGLFDDNLIGAYGEDADLSLRVRQLGFQLRAIRLGVSHLGGMTSALVPESKEWFTHNMAYLRQKWEKYLVTHQF